METKPGWQTTEFWMTIVTVVITSLLSAGVFDDVPTVAKVCTAIVAALAALGYTASRSSIKIAASNAIIERDTVQLKREELKVKERIEQIRERVDLAKNETVRAELRSREAVFQNSQAVCGLKTDPDSED